jgi:hypothetical protein
MDCFVAELLAMTVYFTICAATPITKEPCLPRHCDPDAVGRSNPNHPSTESTTKKNPRKTISYLPGWGSLVRTTMFMKNETKSTKSTKRSEEILKNRMALNCRNSTNPDNQTAP